MQNSGKKILVIIFCFAISILGIYMQFFYKGESGKKKGNEVSTEKVLNTIPENTEKNIYEGDYSNQELPDEENISDDEMYTDYKGEAVKIYFTNTELLDQSSMPLEAQAELAEDVQRFLEMNEYENIFEIPIEADEFIDDDEKVQFICTLEGYEEKLQVTFSKKERKLKFATVYIDSE